MARYDSFDVDVQWNRTFTRSEILSGRAQALRKAEATNVRGSLRNWLQMAFCVHGKQRFVERIQRVPLGEVGKLDVSRSAFPSDIAAGKHACELKIKYPVRKGVKMSTAEETLPMEIEVLPDDYVCLRMDRAELLAAHVMTSSEVLSRFVSENAGDVDGRDQPESIRAIYSAMCARELKYQRVPQPLFMDYQQVRRPEVVLSYGGSCADLSLLFAALFYLKGLSPLIVMLEDHMMAGCWVGDYAGTGKICYSAAEMQQLADDGRVLLLDCVTVCAGQVQSIEASVEQAAERISPSSLPAVMVDVCAAIRSGIGCVYADAQLDLSEAGIPEEPEDYEEEEAEDAQEPADMQTVFCYACRYDLFKPEDLTGPLINCPSCGKQVRVPPELIYRKEEPAPEPEPQPEPQPEPMPEPEVVPEPEPMPEPEPPKPEPVVCRPLTISSETAVCMPQGAMAVVTGAPRNAEAVAIADTFRGLPVVKVRDNAFKGCRLREVSLAPTIRMLGDYAFRGCERLEWVDLPGEIESLGTGVFSDCTALREVRIPGSVKRIPRRAFSRCIRLTEVLLADGVEEIDEYGFADCSAMEQIVIPASVKRIRANAFNGCKALTQIHLESDATLVDPRAYENSGLSKM